MNDKSLLRRTCKKPCHVKTACYSMTCYKYQWRGKVEGTFWNLHQSYVLFCGIVLKFKFVEQSITVLAVSDTQVWHRYIQVTMLDQSVKQCIKVLPIRYSFIISTVHVRVRQCSLDSINYRQIITISLKIITSQFGYKYLGTNNTNL